MINILESLQAAADAMEESDIARILHVNDEPAPDADDDMISLGDIYLVTQMGDRFNAIGNLIAVYDTPKSSEAVEISVDIEGSYVDGIATIDRILSDYHPRERIEDHYSRLRRCAV